jgi:membrane peptidoglycan carboxypeptidase
MGVEGSLDLIQKQGDKSYCTDGIDTYVGLAAAIGGCGLKQTEHANTFATLVRGGVYRPVADILEVKDSSDKVIYEWQDEPEQVIDPESAYIVSDILHDSNARAGTFGYNPVGMYINGVQTGTKTGTTDTGGAPKDLWMNSFSTQAVLSVWYGNHVPKALRQGSSLIPGQVVDAVMKATHNNIFADPTNDKWGKYHWGGSSDWLQKPGGIQTLNINGKSDLFPSWYNKNQRTSSTEVRTFDVVSKKLATECTPEAARIEKEVTRYYDPLTRKDTYKAEEGWDPDNNDDVHSCSDIAPQATFPTTPYDTATRVLIFDVAPGTHPLSSVTINLNGEAYSATSFTDVAGKRRYSVVVPAKFTGTVSVSVVVEDTLFYRGSASTSIKTDASPATPITP